MKQSINRQIVRAAVMIILIAAILMAGYYWLLLKPQLAMTQTLFQAEQVLAAHHFNLLSNRLALTNLAKLDTSQSHLIDEKNTLLKAAQQTNEHGRQELAPGWTAQLVKAPLNNTANFINSELYPALPGLFSQHRDFFQKQQPLLDQLQVIDTVLTNIFLYDPATDLQSPHPLDDRQELILRAQAAKEGLEKIRKNLNTTDMPTTEKQVLETNLINAQVQLNKLLTHLNTAVADEATVSSLVYTFIEQFNRLKQNAVASQQALIRSKKSVSLLTDQTNLLIESQQWLDRIHAARLQLTESGPLKRLQRSINSDAPHTTLP